MGINEMNFGNIPNEVLNLKVKSWDGEEEYLRDLITLETDQDIEDSISMVEISNHSGEPLLWRFQAWTKDHILLLIHDQVGSYLARIDRHPQTKE